MGCYAGICVRKNMEIGWMEGIRVLGGIRETNAAELERLEAQKDGAWDKAGAHLSFSSERDSVQGGRTKPYRKV